MAPLLKVDRIFLLEYYQPQNNGLGTRSMEHQSVNVTNSAKLRRWNAVSWFWANSGVPSDSEKVVAPNTQNRYNFRRKKTLEKLTRYKFVDPDTFSCFLTLKNTNLGSLYLI